MCLSRVHEVHAAISRMKHTAEMKNMSEESGETEETEKPIKCKIHKEKKMKLFCEEDQVLVCSHCLLFGEGIFFCFLRLREREKLRFHVTHIFSSFSKKKKSITKITQDHIAKIKFHTNATAQKNQ